MTILFSLAAALSGAALQAAPAPAPTSAPVQAAPATAQVAVGAAVSDQSGAPVGTIQAIDGANAVIDTGTNKVAVPLTAIGPGASGLITTVTRAQLNAAATQGPAEVKALLVAGTEVKGSAGATVGTIKAADDKFATITTPGGDVRVPANAFAVQNGSLMIGMTAEQFAAAAAPAAGTKATGTKKKR